MTDGFSAEGAEAVLASFATASGRIHPHETWHKLRAIAPVYRQPAGDLLVTGYAEVREILTDARWFSVGDVAVAEAKRSGSGESVSEHEQLAAPIDMALVRPVVNKLFSAAAIAPYRPRVARVVSELLDDIDGRDQVELVGGFTRRIPFAVLAELLGFPSSERTQLLEWANEAGGSTKDQVGAPPSNSVLRAVDEFMTRLAPMIVERRAGVGDDLLAALVEAFDEAGLDRIELRKVILTLVIAASDTTTNLVANGVYALLDHPDQLRRLRDDPSLLPTAVDEVLRWITSVKAVVRVASEDLQVKGVRVAAGTHAGLALVAANRDPSVFPDPDRFDITRRPNPHLALARGAHHCLGAALARVIAQEAIWQFFERFPDATIARDGVQFHDDFVAALFTSLPMRLTKDA